MPDATDPATRPNEFERGKEVGRVDQILKDHGDRLNAINGTISATGEKLAELTTVVQGLREDARLRDERVRVAADTLADETERRRSDLADTAAGDDRTWTRNDRMRALAFALAGVALTVVALITR